MAGTSDVRLDTLIVSPFTVPVQGRNVSKS